MTKPEQRRSCSRVNNQLRTEAISGLDVDAVPHPNILFSLFNCSSIAETAVKAKKNTVLLTWKDKKNEIF